MIDAKIEEHLEARVARARCAEAEESGPQLISPAALVRIRAA